MYYIQFLSKHWTLGQEINTPSLHKTIDKKDMDYPYSGWLFLRFSKERYKNADFGVGWGVTFGVSGAEASLAKKMQNTYHILILNLEELSWSFSIPQAFHINAQTSFSMRTGRLNKKIMLKIMLAGDQPGAIRFHLVG